MRRATGLDVHVHYATATGDATIDVTANRHRYRDRAQVKAVDRFAVPALLKANEKVRREPLLLVAPYITREMAQHCRALHLPFIDTAGNAYLQRPGLFAYVAGQPKPRELKQVHFRALNPAGLQVAFALLCRPALVQTNYREIARRAGVALGTVGAVMKDLKARGHLRHYKQGNDGLVNPLRLLEEWVTHYLVTLRPKLNPRRFRAASENLRQLDVVNLHAQWGGEVAADRLTHYLKPAHYTICTQAPAARLVAAGRMTADPAGNVEILDRFWNLGPEPDKLDIVPAILVYADLLATHDPRNSETARIIHQQRIAPTFSKSN